MKNICIQSLKHTGQWQIASLTPVLASEGNMSTPSIRGSLFNYDARIPGSFIEGERYT
jgi:hypothetical protein